ncbi:bifunctional diguanylate cyclase/phosphodiesterase [Nocardioides sp.]|uniref:putative bifunctional diguanylate cyclase/phosphodiesterase n=1 Tax=Nocardioides sp. TaxID=35761 RepID=UPI00263958C3|nr:GGDEF and EAL domain-containing protein [Nocardioides sp.]
MAIIESDGSVTDGPVDQGALEREMLDASVDCIKVIDLDGCLIHMNRSGCEALGVTAEQVEAGFGMKWLPLLPPECRARGRIALRRAFAGESARFNGRSIAADGSSQFWDNLLTPVVDTDGEVTSVLCVSRDITAQRIAEERLRNASETDALTGLMNRRAFRARLKRVVARCHRDGSHMGVVLIDLDDFKTTNDTLGHAAGDHLLRAVARRLSRCLPADGVLARLGGDEFAICLERVYDRDEMADLAQRVSRQLDKPILFGDREINGAMTVGWATLPGDASDETGLMSAADIALNHAKSTGRGGIQAFDPSLRLGAVRALEQLTLARDVLRRGAVVPTYQPKVLLADGSLAGFEALLRWHQVDGELGAPALLAEAFTHHELAVQLATQMHRQVAADIADWLNEGLPAVPVSINASPVELLRPDFASALLAVLEEYDVPTSLIEVEISENTLVERGSTAVFATLAELKAAGVGIALDDFGTGQSSLARIRDYPVDTIKIDRSFVTDITRDMSQRAIVQAITSIGAALAADVVAEGVETAEQGALLRSAGCGMAQGFHFGHAGSADDARALLVTRAAQRRWAAS